MKKLGIFLSILFIVWACKKSDEKLGELFIGFRKPVNFPEPTYNLSRNSITEAGFELGKRLFYEGRLSRNNTISCGSCHIQSAAFTHHGHDVSHGIDDRLGTRNPQPIMNMAWDKSFFWEGGVFDLDLSSVRAITSAVEMDETVPNVLVKLRAHPEYPNLFKAAFGTTEITDERFFKALSQFLLMTVSDQSKYDKVMRNESGYAFTEEEKSGYLFFQNNCAKCHEEPLFKDQTYRNNGLKPSPINDLGRYEITLNPLDKYKFKVPSLRNWQYTSPYMHDGRFLTIERVLEHYRSGIVDSETLDPILKGADGSLGIPMSDLEMTNLVAFLKTLNDREFVTNPLLSEPSNGSTAIK